ncbi:MAG: Lrp/AsnC family transcriptional regulator [Rhodospirillaceae bacterium]|nr:Lrp/AsnC family transcriptional regulator [Rhodospirillaceae bacterium]
MQELDEIDRKILRAYQKNPEITMEKLGAVVGLSHTPCWRRVRKLHDDGVILGTHLRLNREVVGLALVVLVQLRLSRHDEETLAAFEKAVQRQPEILDCYSMAGDHDYSLKIVCADTLAYEQLLKRTLLHLPGVASVNSHVALKEIKSAALLPI